MLFDDAANIVVLSRLKLKFLVLRDFIMVLGLNNGNNGNRTYNGIR